MTRLGRSVVVTGDMTSDEDIIVDGRVLGPVLVRNASLIIGESGRVDADVHGATVVVHGTLAGTITATDRIELHPSSRVEGSLIADHVVITDGARFNGTIDINQRATGKGARLKAELATTR